MDEQEVPPQDGGEDEPGDGNLPAITTQGGIRLTPMGARA